MLVLQQALFTCAAKHTFIKQMQEHGNPPDRWMWHELIKSMLIEVQPAAEIAGVLLVGGFSNPNPYLINPNPYLINPNPLLRLPPCHVSLSQPHVVTSLYRSPMPPFPI
jgi:hypothetical protein